MFLIPEIFFLFIPSFFAFMLGYNNFPSIVSKILTDSFLESNPIVTFLFLGVEFFGVLGLLIWNIKFNNYKYKIFFSIILALLLALLVLIFFVGYAVVNMSFP